ncbi:hypothetical protein [Paraglaciecola sp. L3A3]|uniref:hypothetical protein n=1 Tax=Paraglaciecola sp. L3A3 TaxID=2686358 RepID=UPI00131A7ADD|nr:hypothetical protein [Paraglaciecola sp. L3A3]
MQFVLLDPGFEDISSHHANVNRQLYLHAKKADVALTILAAKKLVPSKLVQSEDSVFQQSIKPWFKTPCYTNNLKPLDVIQEQALAQQFCNELEIAIKDNIIQSNDTLLIHTCFSFHVLGLAIWLLKIKNAFTGKLVVCGMFYPGKRVLKDGEDFLDFVWYLRNRLAFILLKEASEKLTLTLATSCASFIEAYQNCTGLAFTLHPVINYIPPSATFSKTKPCKRVILYIGSVKRDKGVARLHELIPDLMEQTDDLEFFIHFNQASPGAREFISLKPQLIQLAKTHTNLKLHFSPMSQSEYEYQLSISDAIVLLYEPQKYQLKTSGLLWDAIRYPDLAVICSTGIWAEYEYIAIGGSPFTFDYEDKQDVIATIKQWQSADSNPLQLTQYGYTINQPFADWCFSSPVNM